MTIATPTTAGLLASVGAAPAAAYGPAMAQVPCHHPSSTWTQGTLATSTTFMVLTGKNRPTRPLSERSP
jgi:hypothetical protein